MSDLDELPDSPGKVLVHRRQDREQGVRSWLLLSADDTALARKDWANCGIALLRGGVHFSAVRLSPELVHSAARTSDADGVRHFLAEVLHGGPVFVDQHRFSYYALVPPSAAAWPAWRGRQFEPDAVLLGGGTYIGVPRPEFSEPGDHFSYWVVPMDGPGDLCPFVALAQLAAHGAHRLAAEANDDQ
ncbi:hypothetical protein [[Kitasatospora] papulosa]|uniref:hypothetical protein n=1 Tax=[Kitasatospora] papulosa TaxID=1464011 RepID=UPI0036C020DE